jgi:hypothetical protein
MIQVKYVIIAVLVILIFHRIYRYFFSPNIWHKKMIKDHNHYNNVIIYSAYDAEYAKRPFVQINAEILKKYAKKHNHTYRQLIDTQNKISPYWLRVYYLKQLLNDTQEGTYIAYFDADAIPIHPEISIPTFIASLNETNFDIYISEDPQIELNPIYPGKYNTGVYIVKNSQKTKEFVDKWLALYDTTKWNKKNDKWTCTDNNVTCWWSGEYYEQGSFSKLSQTSKLNIVKGLKPDTLACNKNGGQNCFVMHLMQGNDTEREYVFKDFLENKM